MNKNRLIFYGVFAFFHLFILIFSLYMDSHKNDFTFLVEMQKKIWMIKYGSIIGVILLVVDFVWVMRDGKQQIQEKNALEHELNTLKAKLFDMQEAGKKNLS
jgi:hypothetical protein